MPVPNAVDRVSTIDSATSTASSSSSLLELTVPEIQAAYASGELTAVELTQYYLDRIAAYEDTGPMINGFTQVFAEGALKQAAALDAEYETTGSRGPLHGVPIVIKDNIDQGGIFNSVGYEPFTRPGTQIIPPDDADVVDRLKDAGAIVIGRTNLPDFAGGGNTISSAYGATLNPYDITRSSGGSSGGTGAAIAANFAVFGLGTDSGGSIRIPTTNNNLVGIKPTFGLISNDGVFPGFALVDVVGPMTRSVTDAAIAMDVLTDRPPAGGTSYTDLLDTTALEGIRIGVFDAYIENTNEDVAELIDPRTRAIFESTLAEFEAEGATIVDGVLADSKVLEGFADVGGYSAYDWERYLAQLGPDADFSSLDELNSLSDLTGDLFFNDPDSADSSRTNPIESFDSRYQEYFQLAAQKRAAIIGTMEEFDLDVLIYPTILQPPALFDAEVGSAPGFVNETGLPSIVVPAGFYEDGLPFGVELLGQDYSEGQLISYAYDYEQATEYRQSPGFTPDLFSIIGTGLQTGSEGELIDLRPQVGKMVEAAFNVSRDAGFDNVVGFYAVQNESGAVLDTISGKEFKPDDPGYAEAAVRLSQENGLSFSVEDTTVSFDLKGGSIYAPYLIADGTVNQVLNQNGNDNPDVFFNYTGAHASKVDYIKLLGQNQFGFEDLIGGGDQDFNDAVLKLDLQVT